MSTSWNPSSHQRVVAARARMRLVAMLVALGLFIVASTAVSAALLHRQRARFEVATQIEGPTEWAGMRIELVEFRRLDVLPGNRSIPTKDVSAMPNTTFVLAVVRQTVTDAETLGSARLQLGRGDQRWADSATNIHPDSDLSYSPLIPEHYVGLASSSEPAPRTGDQVEFGQVWMVPTSVLGEPGSGDEIRPVVTVESRDLDERPRDVWL